MEYVLNAKINSYILFKTILVKKIAMKLNFGMILYLNVLPCANLDIMGILFIEFVLN